MASLLSMARPSKSKVRSRSNGAKASNAGKLTSRQDKQERCVVMVQQTKKEMEENTKRGIHPRDVCKFKVVFRSKLLKHEVYEDAEDAKVWVVGYTLYRSSSYGTRKYSGGRAGALLRLSKSGGRPRRLA